MTYYPLGKAAAPGCGLFLWIFHATQAFFYAFFTGFVIYWNRDVLEVNDDIHPVAN
jgi:hypothetical protein